MELRQYLQVLGKWMWLIMLSVLIAASSSYLASRAATPLYRTRTTLMVGRVTQNPDPNSAELNTGQQLAYTYIQLARREPVLKGAIESLGLQMNWQALTGQVTANIVPQTQLIEISVVDSDPYRAKVLADAIAAQLIQQSPTSPSGIDQEILAFTQQQLRDLQDKLDTGQADVTRLKSELDAANSARQIQDLQNQISVLETKITDWQKTYSQLLISMQGGDVNALSVVERATIPGKPISPNIQMNVLLAAVIGLILAVGGIVLIEYLDDTVKTPDDVSHATNLATLGAITRIEGEQYADKLIAAKQPLSPIVEAYRVLRTNIQFSSLDKPAKTLMMTSPSPSEGKSITLANLAVVMAQSGLRVIVVDTDLRRPVQHRIFGVPNRYGLSDAALNGSTNIRERLQATGIENLELLSSGSLPPNPAEMLGSERMKTLVAELKNCADIVLFDSPPTLIVADAAILGANMDGVILVNDSGRTRRNDSRRAAEELRRVRANLLGVVLNRLTSSTGGSYYYYHYYYQEDGAKKRRRNGSNWLERRLPFFRQTSSKADK